MHVRLLSLSRPFLNHKDPKSFQLLNFVGILSAKSGLGRARCQSISDYSTCVHGTSHLLLGKVPANFHTAFTLLRSRICLSTRISVVCRLRKSCESVEAFWKFSSTIVRRGVRQIDSPFFPSRADGGYFCLINHRDPVLGFICKNVLFISG